MLIKTGIPTITDINTAMPSPQRLAKGPVAVMECFQHIPCDPCYWSCHRGAIRPFTDITALPQIESDKCNGCALCVANCPGLAIFILDYSYAPDTAMIKIPYEYLPWPAMNTKILGLDREGKEICLVTVVKVQQFKHQKHTAILWLTLPQEHAMAVRNVKVGGWNNAD